jgi:toxin CptA
VYNRIDLSLSPSRVVGLLAAGPWLLLSLAILIAAGYVSTWVALAMPMTLAGALDRWRRCGALSHPRAVVRLVTTGQRLFVTRADHNTTEMRPLPESRLSGRFLYLALEDLRGGDRMQAVLIPRTAGGNTPPESLRRLRTWLRLMPAVPAPIMTPNALQRLWPGGQHHDH